MRATGTEGTTSYTDATRLPGGFGDSAMKDRGEPWSLSGTNCRSRVAGRKKKPATGGLAAAQTNGRSGGWFQVGQAGAGLHFGDERGQ